MSRKVLFAGFAVSALALAQMGGDSTGAGVPPPPRKETKSDQIVNRLKLNQDQITEYRTILEATAKESLRVVNQWLRARTTLATATANGKSRAEIDPLVKTLGDAQLQMTNVELGAFRKIYALLKPNQTAKAAEAFDLMFGLFEPQLADLDNERKGGAPAAKTGTSTQPNKVEAIATTLNLNRDQKKAVKTILEDGAKVAAPLRDQVSKSRIAVGAAAGAKKSDDEIKQAVETSSELSTQLTQVELNAFAKISATLDDAQKADRQSMGRVLILMNNIYSNKNWNGD